MSTKEQGKTEESKLCYECKLLPWKDEYMPFCSQLCHKLWSGKNYKESPKINQTLKDKLKTWKFK